MIVAKKNLIVIDDIEKKLTGNRQNLDLNIKKQVMCLVFFDLKIQKHRYVSVVFPPECPFRAPGREARRSSARLPARC